MKKIIYSIVLLVIILSAEYASAASGSSSRSSSSSGSSGKSALFLEAGQSFVNMNKTTKDSATGSSNLLGTSQLLFSLGAKIGSFRPEVGYTIIPRKPEDKSYSSTLMIIQLPYLFDFGQLSFKAGPTYWIQKISGEGGNVTLSNGTGTSTFSKPGLSSSAKNLGLLLGAYYPINSSFGIDTDLTVLAPMTKKRSFNFIAQLTWNFYDL